MIVLRSTHDAIVREKDQRITDLTTRLAIAEARRDDCLGRVEELKDDLREAKKAPVMPERKEPSALAKAIRDAAAGDSRLAAHFWSVAKDFKAKNPQATEDEVIGQIGWTTGEPSE